MNDVVAIPPVTETNFPVVLDGIAEALELASTNEDLLKLKDLADAVTYTALKAKSDRVASRASILRARITRTIGQNSPKKPSGRPKTYHNKNDQDRSIDSGKSDDPTTRRVKHDARVVAELSPDRFDAILADAEATDSVVTDAELKRAAKIERAEKRVAELNELAETSTAPPDGRYDVVVVDPPWPVQLDAGRPVDNRDDTIGYPTMALDEIEELRPPFAEHCHVFLWTTPTFLHEAFHVLEEWGVDYRELIVWHKSRGMKKPGGMYRNAEFILYGRKGSPVWATEKGLYTCFNAPWDGKSAKPALFYEWVVEHCPGRRIDMFSRRAIPGFDGWGNESPEDE